MNILVLNCGSSSLKYSIHELRSGKQNASGSVERIGEDIAHCANHRAAVRQVSETILGDGQDIDAIGHRIVHGGEIYSESVLITPQVEANIEQLGRLAPLHNPAHIQGIRAARDCFPGLPHVAVFDTAFHQTLPEHVSRYAIPTALYEEHGIRRYGFHGTSHRYVSERAAEILEVESITGVTCHLGNGCSAAAIQDGKSVDTTMGFTPLAGIPMGTRSGDVDPAVVLYLQNEADLSPSDVDRVLNRESGLTGVSGVSNDLREVEEAEGRGDEGARLAINVFAYQTAKAIAGLLGTLSNANGIAFTGGIGENASGVRQRIVNYLQGVDVVLDPTANGRTVGREGKISAPESGLEVLVVQTREDEVIARDTFHVVQRDAGSSYASAE
ncbi:MAG: acetate kinase [Gemmatimonadetes bacterium]|nr:acetate kinase [Gemmatimonadota bacterium]